MHPIVIEKKLFKYIELWFKLVGDKKLTYPEIAETLKIHEKTAMKIAEQLVRAGLLRQDAKLYRGRARKAFVLTDLAKKLLNVNNK